MGGIFEGRELLIRGVRVNEGRGLKREGIDLGS